MITSGYSVFCDDIRQEINGKLTLVGCYQGSIIFFSEAPSQYPKFCIFPTIQIPSELDFEYFNIYIEVVKDDGTSEIVFDTGEQKNEFTPDPNNSTDPDSFLAISTNIIFSPFNFSEIKMIRVRARIDEGDPIKLGALKVEVQAA